MAGSSDDVAGWAAFSEDDSRVECAVLDTATTERLARWLLDAAGSSPVSVAVYHGQAQLRAILASNGFADEGVPLAGLRHPAKDTGVRPPAGYRIRPLEEGEEALRLQAHRRAWKPANLPFTEHTLDSIDQAAESRLDAGKFAAMQSAGLYQRDLDLVIQAPDGSLAGSCTVWLDPSSGWAASAARHRAGAPPPGLGADPCARRVPSRSRGGREVFINSAPLPYYRAPWDAYLKAGFEPMQRGTRMRRPAASGVH